MYQPPGVKTSSDLPVSDLMKAWVLGDPDQLHLSEKPTPVPSRAEVLVRIDAVAICATDLEIIHAGSPASIQGGLPFNKNFTPGHEYMGTVAALGPDVDEFRIGERVSVEIHAGCGQCKRCRQGMYTSCLNYGKPDKGHRANGFTTDGGFAEYAVNHINTLARVPDTMSDAEATLVVTAGTSMYGLTEFGGIGGRRERRGDWPRADRTSRSSCGQGARRKPGHPDRHAQQAAGDRRGIGGPIASSTSTMKTPLRS
ncbi:alcohol dehydrogenase catalytic domain-containing protein [Bradyrhizobium sp. NAS96.2]|uniref:alcohol dehydrogenase catalytic domain-containing protein n=1 Tax=Bradyrhizobium sp. NAS96.2 TaxID=1680160 RepID=UPI000A8A5848|nr:alcohol dehydrogenase catalytic domain-containing protein [Bradyrhizobium sp. NAS96.2]